MAKRKNNALKIGLISLLIIGGIGVGGYFLNDYIKNQKLSFTDEQLVSTLEEKSNIELTVRKSSVDSEFGSQIISYNITPNVANDEIVLSINYTDGTKIEEGILLVDHDSVNKEIVISCNKAFTKQIELTLYSKNNENVSAKLYIDFLEKLTMTSTLQMEEGKTFEIINNIESTGGTLLADRKIENEVISYEPFTPYYMENYLEETDSFYDYIVNSDYYEITEGDKIYRISSDHGIDGYNNGKLHGMTDEDLKNMLGQTYSFESYFNSIYVEITDINYDLIDSSDNITQEKAKTFSVRRPLSTLSNEKLEILFDGERTNIHYKCLFNNKEYFADFGLKFDINLTAIALSKSNIYF